jgi:hypothetical protein
MSFLAARAKDDFGKWWGAFGVVALCPFSAFLFEMASNDREYARILLKLVCASGVVLAIGHALIVNVHGHLKPFNRKLRLILCGWLCRDGHV